MKKTAYLVSKGFFWGFSLFATFVLLFSVLAFIEYYFGWEIPLVEIIKRENQDFARINIIIISVEFLFSYTVILMWSTMIFYSIYFYTLKNFFTIFISEKTFTQKSINKLTSFFKLNFIPVLVGCTGVIYRYIDLDKFKFDEPHFFVLIHLIIAFFLYFYLDLIKKGTNIQTENDLTI